MGIYTKAVTLLARSIGLTDPQLYRFIGGGESNAGEHVTVNTALQLDTVWACVRLIAQTISTLPLQLYRRDKQGYGIPADDHPLYNLLHDQPNADMTAVSFWEAIVACILLWGNGYAAKDRRGDGHLSSLTPLLPSRLTRSRQPDGSWLWKYTGLDGFRYDFIDDEILHIKGFSVDGYSGISPIGQAREQLGIAMAAERSAASFFRNGMRPSMVMSAPAYLTKTQRAEYEERKDDYVGAVNAGKIPLLEGGWKVEQISMNPDDAQLLATRSFSIETICRWYGVQPVMIGHMEKSTAWGTGLEQMNLWFLTYSLRPLLKAIEQEIRRSLLQPAEKQGYYAEFNVEGLLRADSTARAALMKTLAENGLRTRNELRGLDNMPPMDGGDDLTVMTNLLPIQLLGTEAHTAVLKPVDPGFVGSPTPKTPATPNQ